MTNEEFYGEDYKKIQRAQRDFFNVLSDLKEDNPEQFMYISTRIKSADSVMEKSERKGVTYEEISDIVGFRVVCPFIFDIYYVADKIKEIPNITVITEKDYIKDPKPSGYKSYHLILKTQYDTKIEIQIRTIAIDFWAALEHKIRYKKNIQNEKLIADELKRIANNITSLDIDMETLKDIILEAAPC